MKPDVMIKRLGEIELLVFKLKWDILNDLIRGPSE